MKNKLKISFYSLLALMLITFTSCDYNANVKQIYPIYTIQSIPMVPDSMKIPMGKYITELVKASNNNLTAGDYEDVEDVISEANEIAEKIYTRNVLHLKIENYDGTYNYKSIDEMTDEEKVIYTNLLK